MDVELDAHAWRGLAYLEAVSGPGAIAELVAGFVSDAPDRLARMKAALAEEDWATLGRLAHDLKSNCAVVGASRLSGLAAEIERTAGAGMGPHLTGRIEEVEAMLPGLLTALEAKVAGRPE